MQLLDRRGNHFETVRDGPLVIAKVTLPPSPILDGGASPSWPLQVEVLNKEANSGAPDSIPSHMKNHGYAGLTPMINQSYLTRWNGVALNLDNLITAGPPSDPAAVADAS